MVKLRKPGNMALRVAEVPAYKVRIVHRSWWGLRRRCLYLVDRKKNGDVAWSEDPTMAMVQTKEAVDGLMMALRFRGYYAEVYK